MNYTRTDQEVARFMLADHDETGQWRRLNPNDIVSQTSLTADQVHECVLRLGEGDLIEEVQAINADGQLRVTTFGKLTDQGILLAQSP
ncbi:hypothetical protein [Nocardiopsis lambiniae]|uniref:MarR family transcriptional regulator n=1 Tax=Nocardiopsis lambiniae TaxID=3075539 RepID=A0ABU2MFU6_9ACTN|nr:hypothetical protein [Nocardiopsis sp. DSM 44743]MDT0331468.1 hypothetical protein [Nocardiopsis sp. DSM 44743]